MEDGRLVVKAKTVANMALGTLEWGEMFAGPKPVFEQSKAVVKPSRKSGKEY